ncbi:MAG: hypothetical protein Q8N53_23930 [Longimicrobiales bacterium]|nr:hypothetical protein [Longimicrobiales bacterium]
MIHTVLLEPLPFAEPERLVTVPNSYPGAGAPRTSDGSVPMRIGAKRSAPTPARQRGRGDARGRPPGALAYSVTQRRREIGIRMAMGSAPEDVFRSVVGQGMRVTAAGLVDG